MMLDFTIVQEQFPWLFEPVYDVAIWAWLAIPTLAFSAFVISAIICTTIRLVFSRAKKKRESWESASHRTGIYKALQLFLAGILFSISETFLPLGEQAQQVLAMGETTIFVYAIAWWLFIAIDRLMAKLSYILGRNNRRSARAVLPLLRKVAKALVVIIAILFLLQNFGFDVATIIAGLGIGGVAIALASQKSVENLFGGITLILDQPVRVGDFCRYDGGRLGIIEDVGLRSTRIRSLDRTLITVPNASFSQMTLENFMERDRILMWETVGVRYDTSAQTMRSLIKALREMLLTHSLVNPEPARVRFIKFNSSSLDIEFFVYVETIDWDEFLEIREELYLGIMDVLEAHDVEVAFPSRTVYMEQGRQDNVMQLNAQSQSELNNPSGTS